MNETKRQVHVFSHRSEFRGRLLMLVEYPQETFHFLLSSDGRQVNSRPLERLHKTTESDGGGRAVGLRLIDSKDKTEVTTSDHASVFKRFSNYLQKKLNG